MPITRLPPSSTVADIADVGDEPSDAALVTAPSSASECAQADIPFLDCLADPERWPPLEQRVPWLRWLGGALTRWPRWPADVGLEMLAQKATSEEAVEVIHAAEADPHIVVMVCHHLAGTSDSYSVCLRRGRSWTPPDELAPGGRLTVWVDLGGGPNGFFDALALGLVGVSRQPHRRAPHALGPTTGHHLRAGLADWLRHTRDQGPRTPDGLAWQASSPTQRPEPVPQRLSSPAPALSALIERPGEPTPLARRPPGTAAAAPAHADQAIHRPDPKLRLPALPAPPPHVTVASVPEALALVEQFRQGCWSEAMLPVVCHTITRLEFITDAGRRAGFPVFRLIVDGGTPQRFALELNPDARPSRRFIDVRGPTSQRQCYVYFDTAPDCPAGPYDGVDGLLMAFFVVREIRSLRVAVPRSLFSPETFAERAQQLRHQIAALLTDQLDFVRLCLTLHRMWPREPFPELLLRPCLDGHAASWEGQQILNPALIRRSLHSAADVQLLRALTWPPGERRRVLFEEGFPMLQVGRLLGPRGATLEGRRTLLAGAPVRAITPHIVASIHLEFPRMLHWMGLTSTVIRFLGIRQTGTLIPYLSQDELNRYRAEAITMMRAGLFAVEVPDIRLLTKPPQSNAA